MRSRHSVLDDKFLWRTAGTLIFIAAAMKPEAAECASFVIALRAWTIRLACAAGWAWFTVAFGAGGADVDFQRITPGPAKPIEIPKPIEADDEEKSRINLRVVVSLALLVFIEKLVSDRTSLSTRLASPKSIAAWLDVAISTTFWTMISGALFKKPRQNYGLSPIDMAEQSKMPSSLPKPSRRPIDRASWLMFLLFFGVCFAVSLWANGGNLRLGQTWVGALESWGELLIGAASLAFFWTPIPAILSCADPEIVRITPVRQKTGQLPEQFR